MTLFEQHHYIRDSVRKAELEAARKKSKKKNDKSHLDRYCRKNEFEQPLALRGSDQSSLPSHCSLTSSESDLEESNCGAEGGEDEMTEKPRHYRSISLRQVQIGKEGDARTLQDLADL